MPGAIRKTKKGWSYRGRTYKSKAKAETGKRMALAIEHGFKPTGAKGTGRIKKAARKAARKGRKRKR